jgi:hypothetical protein
MEQMDILLRFGDEGEIVDESLALGYANLAKLVNELELESRAKTIALERLEESLMWAEKGLE